MIKKQTKTRLSAKICPIWPGLPDSINSQLRMTVHHHHTLGQALNRLLQQLQGQLPKLERLSVAIYDSNHQQLRSLAHSSSCPAAAQPAALRFHQLNLRHSPSLTQLTQRREPRVIDNLQQLASHPAAHTQALLEAGFKSSLSLPLFRQEKLLGVLFCNARTSHYFDHQAKNTIEPFAQQLSELLQLHLEPLDTLAATINALRTLNNHHDLEDEGHLLRVAAYAREIAIEVADQKGLTDEEVEYIYRYAPLHDLGKLSLPPQLLALPGKLTVTQWRQVQSHVLKGVEMLDQLIEQQVLRFGHCNELVHNLVATHHERWDGSGYPHQLNGQLIPIEGRILAVADVFDALTSPRPYNRLWPVEQAFDYLQRQSGHQFDPDCVAAALARKEQIDAIQQRLVTTES